MSDLRERVIALGKKYLAVPAIKIVLDVQQYPISEKHILPGYREGLARWPRRSMPARNDTSASVTLTAPKSEILDCFSKVFFFIKVL